MACLLMPVSTHTSHFSELVKDTVVAAERKKREASVGSRNERVYYATRPKSPSFLSLLLTMAPFTIAPGFTVTGRLLNLTAHFCTFSRQQKNTVSTLANSCLSFSNLEVTCDGYWQLLRIFLSMSGLSYHPREHWFRGRMVRAYTDRRQVYTYHYNWLEMELKYDNFNFSFYGYYIR